MTNEEIEDLNTFKHDLVKQARRLQWKVETLEKENERLKAENAELRERLEKAEKEKLPCKVGDTLYYVSAYFRDGYDTDGKIVYKSGWKIFTVKVDEKNLYCMCDRVSKGEAFFTKEAAEARLEELKRGKE